MILFLEICAHYWKVARLLPLRGLPPSLKSSPPPRVDIPTPYRPIIGPWLDFLDETDRQHNDGQLATVVLPEFVPAKGWHGLLHNQTAWLIKAALLYRRRHPGFQRAIIDVPYHLGR